MFDTIYLQQSLEHAGGELIGSNKSGDLYNDFLSYMIVALKRGTSYIVKSVLETKIEACWRKEEILTVSFC